ncbi:hypothetical protein PANNVG_00588 [Pantoea sp. Nvir]|uniref:hypothetical protein n=1 Tax=unclassified Pantoea TaxID=2630326 RepID=UPI0028A6C31F|nr:hypothetical protein [Pantoea sp.]
MRVKMAFKGIYRFVTAGVLAVAALFFWLNHSPDDRSCDVLQGSHQINERLWLYTTRNDSGGATVPVIYRYFLSGELRGNSKAQAQQLEQQTPFLVGDGTLSAITEDDNNKVKIVYSGNVLSLEQTATYRAEGNAVTLSLSYQIN